MCQPGRPGPHGLSHARLARLGALPEREVRRVLLLLARLDPGAGHQRVHVPAGELAVVALAPTRK